MTNSIRNGNFTSSESVALTTVATDKRSFGKPALTYIEECNMERRLGRSLTDESNARPLSWGKLLEKRVFELIDISYTICSDETLQHPEIDCWVGSPDAKKHGTVADAKCPMTLKSFCQLVDPLYSGLTGMDAMNAIRKNHKDGEKFYWQLVSNAILTNSTHAELIVYVPYKSELDAIRELASMQNEGQKNYYWIFQASDDELPHLIDGGYYKNLNIISFEVPQEDKDALTGLIEAAKLLLIPRQQMKAEL